MLLDISKILATRFQSLEHSHCVLKVEVYSGGALEHSHCVLKWKYTLAVYWNTAIAS